MVTLIISIITSTIVKYLGNIITITIILLIIIIVGIGTLIVLVLVVVVVIVIITDIIMFTPSKLVRIAVMRKSHLVIMLWHLLQRHSVIIKVKLLTLQLAILSKIIRTIIKILITVLIVITMMTSDNMHR